MSSKPREVPEEASNSSTVGGVVLASTTVRENFIPERVVRRSRYKLQWENASYKILPEIGLNI